MLYGEQRRQRDRAEEMVLKKGFRGRVLEALASLKENGGGEKPKRG